VLNLHWIFSDGVGTSKDVARMAQNLSNRLFSISPALVLLSDIQEFFLHHLDNPDELGPYWKSLVRSTVCMEK
jgi:hypothetical protein